ncbi:GFA family protein [Photobacterium sp. 53610]|uniref:GFA family protein n=1 Tax=Photobacterium sp. 53610 TaxID=3102789 RepID=UPI002EDA3857
MNDKCLCGEIQFEVNGGCTNIYQCHCSLCRRVTGSNSNSAVLVESNSFKWLSGTDKITSFIKESDTDQSFALNAAVQSPTN